MPPDRIQWLEGLDLLVTFIFFGKWKGRNNPNLQSSRTCVSGKAGFFLQDPVTFNQFIFLEKCSGRRRFFIFRSSSRSEQSLLRVLRSTWWLNHQIQHSPLSHTHTHFGGCTEARILTFPENLTSWLGLHLYRLFRIYVYYCIFGVVYQEKARNTMQMFSCKNSSRKRARKIKN